MPSPILLADEAFFFVREFIARIKEVKVLQEWNDQRSGPVGCLIGNIILNHIRQPHETGFKRVKGTLFRSNQRMIIGRNSRDRYLPGEWIHHSNISRDHHKAVKQEAGKLKVFNLFISVFKHGIHYWLIPWEVTQGILLNDPKKEGAVQVRIRELDGRYDMNGHDVSRYHKFFVLNPIHRRRLEEAEHAEQLSPRSHGKAALLGVEPSENQLVATISYAGRTYKGPLPVEN